VEGRVMGIPLQRAMGRLCSTFGVGIDEGSDTRKESSHGRWEG